MAHLLFLLHVGSTLYMMGLIWFVQVVHYPLHAHVGTEQFSTYQQFHMKWTAWVVGPPMLIEMITTILFVVAPPLDLPAWYFGLGAVFLLVVWGSTIMYQSPYHNKLSNNFDSEIHKKLVQSNWIRTLFWSLRGGLVLYVTFLLLKQVP
jgi:hypothetical protein